METLTPKKNKATPKNPQKKNRWRKAMKGKGSTSRTKFSFKALTRSRVNTVKRWIVERKSKDVLFNKIENQITV